MSWQIGIHIEECFLEACAVDPQTRRKNFQRWFTPRQIGGAAIRDWASHLGASAVTWTVSTSRPKIYCEKGLGTPPILLVQRPYEELLLQQSKYRRDRVPLAHWHSKAFPLQRDLIFPLSTEHPMDAVMLQTLIGKIELLEQKNVVLLLTPDAKRSGTFADLEQTLRGHEVKVFYGSPGPEEGVDPSTPVGLDAFWWRGILDAFSYNAITDTCQAWQQILAAGDRLCLLNEKLDPFTSARLDCVFTSSFAHYQAIARFYADKKNLLWCGLEDWVLLRPQAQTDRCELPIGGVAVNTVAHHSCSIQPTSEIATSIWGPPLIRSLELGYEPGPISLGKGLKPTLLDLLIHHKSWPESLSGLKINQESRTAQRWRESILALEPYSDKKSASFATTQNGLFAQVRDAIYTDLAGFADVGETTYLIGPLAPVLHSILSRAPSTPTTGIPLQLLPDSAWCLSEALVDAAYRAAAGDEKRPEI